MDKEPQRSSAVSAWETRAQLSRQSIQPAPTLGPTASVPGLSADLTEPESVIITMLTLQECFAGSKRRLTKGELLKNPRKMLIWCDGDGKLKGCFRTGSGEVVHNMQATTHLLLNLSDEFPRL